MIAERLVVLRAEANPDITGVDMKKNATPVNDLAKRAT
jgi:hypothetical protein